MNELPLTPDGKVEYDKKFDGYTADKPLFDSNRPKLKVPIWEKVPSVEDGKQEK